MSEIIDPTLEQAINNLIANYQMAIAIAIVAVIGCIALGISWFIWEHWFTPAESKDIRTASRKKRPLITLAGDDGYAEILNAPVSGPEGILETKNIGRTQEHYTGALPRQQKFQVTDIELSDKKKDVEKTVAVANFISAVASRRLLLRGAKVPIWFAYRGKAIITSLYGLVALQILEGMSKLESLKEAFSLVDITAIKALFSEQWNESQINAQESDKERKGELKAKRFAGKESLIMFFAILIFLVVVVILAMLIAYYFK